MSAMSIVLISVLALFAYMGFPYRTSNDEEYHTLNRKTGFLRTMFTLFTVVGAPHYAIMTTLSYFYRWYAIAFYAGVVLGGIILALLTPRIRRFIDREVHSFSDLSSLLVDARFSALLSCIGLAFMLGVIVAQVVIGAEILSSITRIDYYIACVAIIACVYFYLYWGGYKALVFTDILQGAVMLVFTLILVYYMATIGGEATGAVPNASGMPAPPIFPFVPLFFIAGVGAFVGAPEIWQRILTAGSNRIASLSLVAGSLTILVWGGLLVCIGNMIALQFPDLNPQTAFVDLVSQRFPAPMVGMVTMLLLAALLSTADTELFASALVYQMEKSRLMKVAAFKPTIRGTRIHMAVLSAIVLVACVSMRDLQTVWGILLNLGYVAAPLCIAMMLGRGGILPSTRSKVFLISAISSLSAFMAIALTTGDYFSWWALAVIALAAIPLLFPGSVKDNACIQGCEKR